MVFPGTGQAAVKAPAQRHHLVGVAAQGGHFGGKPHGGVRFRVVRRAAAVGSNLGIVQLGEVFAQIAVGRQAVIAAIDFRHGQRDPLAGLRGQRALAQGTGHAQVALECGGADANEAKQVGRPAQLFLDGLQQAVRGSGRGVDDGGGGDAGHGELHSKR